jgi:hypothetical protein
MRVEHAAPRDTRSVPRLGEHGYGNSYFGAPG